MARISESETLSARKKTSITPSPAQNKKSGKRKYEKTDVDAILRSNRIAKKFLKPTLEQEREKRKIFVDSFDQTEVADLISDPATFAGILSYAIRERFVEQLELAERTEYASSQIGRWAANKSAPPVLVRRAVLKEICNIVRESLKGPLV